MRRLIAGGYAAAGAEGLYRFDATGTAFAVDAPIAAIRNVSAGVSLGGGRWVFVDEAAGEIVRADLRDGAQVVARIASGGEGPCALAVDATASLLAVANYDGGTTALFRLDDDGRPLASPAIHHHRGHGPVAERQEQPHAHWVGFGAGGMLYSADLGSDRVLAFEIEATGNLGDPRTAFAAPPGTGPRQMAFHPALPVAYLVSELASTLTVLRIGTDGMLTALAVQSTLPPGADSGSLVGPIALDAAAGRLYVGNRGHDSIATFALAPDGAARMIACSPSGGRSPRFLLIDGDRLLAAHEQAGGVTMLPFDDQRRPGAVQARAAIPGAAFLGVMR